MKIREMLGEKMFNFSHKETAIIQGVLAQMLIVSGAITVFESPLHSILNILFAFFVLLPISYYNMRNHERNGE